MIRAPICAVVGHVDHGKTTLLDYIRGTALVAQEAGAITQAIGASIIPIAHIKERAAAMIGTQHLTIPGLLFIDTPGHAAFTGMRKRGGNLADIAILIVDLNEGFKPQTREALEILRTYKTPFVIAANKVDATPGYLHRKDTILQDIAAQQEKTITHIDTKLYEIVGVLAEHQFQAERFDRVEDFSRQIAIVPISALHGWGVDSLLAVIVGLAQRYLEQGLHTHADGPAKGTVLEVTEEQGLGMTLNAIIYDGTLRVGDMISLATLDKPITTKVRALFQPNSVGDIRDRKTRFRSVEEAVAATGVKICAPGLENATAGMPFAAGEHADIGVAAQSVHIDTDEEGVIIKADNIGSLEALITLLRERNIPIRSAGVGPVNKKDVAQASTNPQEHAVILVFNTEVPIDVPRGVHLITSDIIYKLLDEYDMFQEALSRQARKEEISRIALPARMEVLQNCMFRASNPMICGVYIHRGVARTGGRVVLERDVKQQIGYIKEIQEHKDSRSEAGPGSKVALSIPGATGGRQVHEGDVLWQAISEEEFRKVKTHAKQLSAQEKELLKEFAEIMRKQHPVWGV